ncbi:MAG: bifunctional DNA-formamidopyrimidine glycosylase/DNA-(apurinic or apyrimidinic site) lyase [Patescibacteria group bacterium]
MPELPEVETIRRGLANKILDKPIVGVVVRTKSLVKSDFKFFKKNLQHNKFTDIKRLGKLLIWRLSRGEHYLLVHLKMTGQLIYVLGDSIIAGGHNLPNLGKLPNKYSHIIIKFADGSRLFFNDLRQFGYFKLHPKKYHQQIAGQFGIEPLTPDFTLINFTKALAKRRISIKAVLLNQKLIAGLGNIYVDEICFRSQVRPTRIVASLKAAEIKRLYLACLYIIKKAIKHRGTTFSDYLDTDGRVGNYEKYLKVYGRAGEMCSRCHRASIKKIKLAGRGTHYCPNCQF